MNAAKQIYGIILLTLYWVILFLILRLVFIFRYHEHINDISTTLQYGLLGDLSSIGFMVGLSSLCLFFISNRNHYKLLKTFKTISALVLIVIIIIDYASLLLYNEWGSTLSWRATSYLANSTEGWNTVLSSVNLYIITYSIIAIIFIPVLLRIFDFFFYCTPQVSNLNIRFLITLTTLVASAIMIRGGLQKIPHSSAVSFFSHNSTDNYAAVNKLRYFIDSYIQTKNTKIYIDTNTQVIELGKIRNTPKGSSFIKTKKPNITLIIMEGIPNAIFDDIYDSEIQIPNLSRIKNKSYSFENMYASGFRTDQGILNLLAGIPAYPYINIMTDVSTIHNQPNLIRTLHEEGYYTSFLYGGDGQFSQLKKYMLHQKLDYYSDESNFDSKSRTMDWGVPDHVFLNQSIKHIKSLGQPHFTTLLTSSTHLPFDYPGNAPHENSKKENFIGSLEYLDNALGPFIDSILISDENNLIIITADHGCLYLGHDFNDHKRFNVPFLVLGNALSDSLLGTQNFNYFNTHDLPKTIESLLNIESNNHPLSSDLTSNKNKSSAYWITEHTMGWLTPKQRLVTDHSASDVYFQSNLHLSSDDEQENLLNYYNETQHYLRSCIK